MLVVATASKAPIILTNRFVDYFCQHVSNSDFVVKYCHSSVCFWCVGRNGSHLSQCSMHINNYLLPIISAAQTHWLQPNLSYIPWVMEFGLPGICSFIVDTKLWPLNYGMINYQHSAGFVYWWGHPRWISSQQNIQAILLCLITDFFVQKGGNFNF